MTNTAAATSADVGTPLDERPCTEDETVQRLYRSYSNQIESFCLRQLGSREDAEDATQLTFLHAYRGLTRGALPQFESAWLFKIAHNVCLNSRRSLFRRRRVETPSDLDTLENVAPPKEQGTEELTGLTDVLRSLPDSQRRAILLREWQGLSYREIGAELDLSQSAVEALLFRARRAVAAGLAEESTGTSDGGDGLEAQVDAGSLVAVLQSVALSTAVKLVTGLATVAATSAVATSPHLQTALSHDLSWLAGSHVTKTGHPSAAPGRRSTADVRARARSVHVTRVVHPVVRATPRTASPDRPMRPPALAGSLPAPPSTLPPASVPRPIGADETGSVAEPARADDAASGPASPSPRPAAPATPRAPSRAAGPPPPSPHHTAPATPARPAASAGMSPRPAGSIAGAAAKPAGGPPATAGAGKTIPPAPAGPASPTAGSAPLVVPPVSIEAPVTSPRLASPKPPVGMRGPTDDTSRQRGTQSLPTSAANDDPPAAGSGRSVRDGDAAAIGDDTAPSPGASVGASSGNLDDQPGRSPVVRTGDGTSRPGNGTGAPSDDAADRSSSDGDPGNAGSDPVDSSGNPGNGSSASPGNSGASPGNSNGSPGSSSGDPGDSGANPGSSSAPGNSGASPSRSSAESGNGDPDQPVDAGGPAQAGGAQSGAAAQEAAPANGASGQPGRGVGHG